MSAMCLTVGTATENCVPQQEKALEELGIPLPHPEKPKRQAQ